MKRSTRITAGVLLGILIAIVAALILEAGRGPTFRPGDHASYEDCVRNIPAEWAPGSLERSGAEDACYFVHQRRR